MIQYNFKEKLLSVPILWGIATAVGYGLIGGRPQKGVLPALIATTFLFALLAYTNREKPKVRIGATVLGMISAGLSGWFAFRYPLPFS